MTRKTFYAVHRYEIVPCHLIARKDRRDGLRYAADSRRDSRRFSSAFGTKEEAAEAVAAYERKMQSLKD